MNWEVEDDDLPSGEELLEAYKEMARMADMDEAEAIRCLKDGEGEVWFRLWAIECPLAGDVLTALARIGAAA